MSEKLIESLECPYPFWKLRCHNSDPEKLGLTGLCVGFESKVWRYDEFAEYILEWLPEFALSYSECMKINHVNARRMLKLAASNVYKTDKSKSRGEFGEMFLHAAVRTVFNSCPIISKIYFKDGPNETVKGFDCVHIVGESVNDMELWLGEVKFYKDISKAISEVIKEIEEHIKNDYLRSEFQMICNKMEQPLPLYSDLIKFLSTRNSLDEIVKRLCIPVLLTYESDVVRNSQEVDENYIREFEKEVMTHFEKFEKRNNFSKPIRIHLFILPLEDKSKLVEKLDEKLKKSQ